MGEGRRRNETCWCQSGLKYKKCHLDREKVAPLSRQELIDVQKRARSIRVCLHPEAGSGCAGEIIRAHSIQRSGGLTRIAEEGHLFTLLPNRLVTGKGSPADDLREPTRMGVREASTFTGMCARHDSILFAPIETAPFTGTREQLFLLGYRALCIDLYRKRSLVEQIPAMKIADRGRPLADQIRIQQFIGPFSGAVSEGMARLEELKSDYDEVARSRDYDAIGGLVVMLERPPEIMSCGMIFPEFDFKGGTLQDLLLAPGPDELSFCLFATDRGGAAVFTWLGEKPKSRALATSLLDIDLQAIPHAIIRFAFEHLENTYFSGTWWKQVPGNARKRLWARLLSGGPFWRRPENCLMDDGLRLVDWKVTDIKRA